MSKITLKIDDFKALASDTRMDILKALDKKKMNLKELSTVTTLHKMTLHEHLTKLVDSGFVKRIERPGHKWVYYKITWKGHGLFHPENNKVVVVFSSAILSIVVSIISLYMYIKSYSVEIITRKVPLNGNTPYAYDEVITQNHTFLYVFIISSIIFLLLVFSLIRLYKRNKKMNIAF